MRRAIVRKLADVINDISVVLKRPGFGFGRLSVAPPADIFSFFIGG
jgi:hypothetical protein